MEETLQLAGSLDYGLEWPETVKFKRTSFTLVSSSTIAYRDPPDVPFSCIRINARDPLNTSVGDMHTHQRRSCMLEIKDLQKLLATIGSIVRAGTRKS